MMGNAFVKLNVPRSSWPLWIVGSLVDDEEGAREETGPNGSINWRLGLGFGSVEGEDGVLPSDDKRSFSCFDEAPEWSWTVLFIPLEGCDFSAALGGGAGGGPSCAARSWARREVIDPCCPSYLVSGFPHILNWWDIAYLKVHDLISVLCFTSWYMDFQLDEPQVKNGQQSHGQTRKFGFG